MSKEIGTKQKILDAALELMARKGFSNTSMSDIVSAGGVEKGTVYHFFRSKQELGEQVLDHYWNTRSGPAEKAIKALSDSPVERVERFCSGETFGVVGNEFYGCFFGNTIAEMTLIDRRLSDKAYDLLGRFRGLIENELEAAAREGELAAGTDTNLLARQLTAYLEGCILLAKGCQNPQEIRELAGGVNAMLAPHRADGIAANDGAAVRATVGGR